VVDTDAVAVTAARRVRCSQANRDHPRACEIHDTFVAFAHDLARARVAKRLEQRAVEGKAPVKVGDDEVEVVHAGSTHHRTPRGEVKAGPRCRPVGNRISRSR
jgi:hypothetical protein